MLPFYIHKNLRFPDGFSSYREKKLVGNELIKKINQNVRLSWASNFFIISSINYSFIHFLEIKKLLKTVTFTVIIAFPQCLKIVLITTTSTIDKDLT